LKKAYYYANAQILRQDNAVANRSFYYVHDRLGSVRLVISSVGSESSVANSYTYSPFGEDFATERTEAAENSFKFTGQWYDYEFGQYYLRARQYDPQIMRFTARDPADRGYEEPIALHKYLYCGNEPINRFDFTGEFWGYVSLVAGITIGEAFRHSDNYASFSALGYAVSSIGAIYEAWFLVPKTIDAFQNSDTYKTWKEKRGGEDYWKGKDADDILDEMGYGVKK
jgi:RHS repeat-associated protein